MSTLANTGAALLCGTSFARLDRGTGELSALAVPQSAHSQWRMCEQEAVCMCFLGCNL